jgi:hypothetical protein
MKKLVISLLALLLCAAALAEETEMKYDFGSSRKVVGLTETR